VKALHQKGWTIDVLTVRPSPNDSFYDPSILRVVPREVTIFRSFPGLFYFFQHLRKKPIKGYPKLTIEWLPFGLLRGIFQVLRQKYDLIVSSALPFVGHLLAFFLRMIGSTPWIADYGDSIGFNPMTSKWKRRLGKMLEGKILKSLSGMIVPFPEMVQSFNLHYPFLKKMSIQSIRHGVSENIKEGSLYNRSDKMRISYVGSFYPADNEPYQFLNALLELTKSIPSASIEFVIAGNTQKQYIDYIEQINLQDRVKLMGQIPHDDAVNVLKKSDVILYIGGRQDDYHFAFKIIESAALGRPILAIKQSEKDVGAEFIRSNHIGCVIPNNSDVIALKLQELYLLWEDNRLESSFKRVSPGELTWTQRADEMSYFFDFILDKSNRKYRP